MFRGGRGNHIDLKHRSRGTTPIALLKWHLIKIQNHHVQTQCCSHRAELDIILIEYVLIISCLLGEKGNTQRGGSTFTAQLVGKRKGSKSFLYPLIFPGNVGPNPIPFFSSGVTPVQPRSNKCSHTLRRPLWPCPYHRMQPTPHWYGCTGSGKLDRIVPELLQMRQCL